MDISALSNWLDNLALSLSPSERRNLLRILSNGLRTRMRDRIKQQRDPDGFRFIPRKRDQIGNIRRQGALFQRLGRHMRTKYSANHSAVGFSGRTGFIAKVHQEGLTQRPKKNANLIAYPKRKTVGFSDDDVKWIEQAILIFLSQK